MLDGAKLDFSSKKQISLPKSLRIKENDDFIVYKIASRKNKSFQFSQQRYILFANDNMLFVILPASQFVMQIPLNYLPEIKKRQKNDLEMARSKINFNPVDAHLQPYSRLPLSFFENDFLMIAAPKGYVTSILIDFKNRPKFIIQTKIPDDEMFIHSLSSFTKVCKYALNQIDGKILSLGINPLFFIKQDPHFVIPFMHYINLKKELNQFSGLIIEESLRIFWNNEIFNELLLLLFNVFLRKNNPIEYKTIIENVGTTFSRFYSNIDKDKCFQSYDSRGNTIKTKEGSTTKVNHCFNSFQSFEINKVFPQDTFNYLSLSIFIELMENQNKIRENIKNDPFDFNSYAKEIQYPVMLQLAALKHVFYSSAGKPISNSNYPFINSSIIPKNLPTPIYSYWVGNNLLELEQNPTTPKEKHKQYQRDLLSFRLNLRNEDLEILYDDMPLQSMFYGIEKLINRTEDSYHSLIQQLYGMTYTDLLYEI